MQILEFETEVLEDKTLRLPQGIAGQLTAGEKVRVSLLPSDDEDDEERAWQRLAAAEFLKGYSEEDAIYDKL